MGDAEHLAVLDRGSPALAPRRNVVGVHLVELVDPALVGVVTHSTQRAVGRALGLRYARLLIVDGLLGGIVKHAHFKELRLLLAAEDELEHSAPHLDVGIGVEPLHVGGHFLWVTRLRVVSLVERPPLQSLHLLLDVLEHS